MARLYRICLLRRVGLPLAEIGRALEDPAWSLRAAMGRHLDELDRRLEATGRLRSRLAKLLEATGDGQITDELLETVEEMTMLDTTVQARITLLVYEDIALAHDWLVRVFGLGAGRVDRDENGRAVHGELQAGDGVIWMHQVQTDEYRLNSPRSVGAGTAAMAVMVDDVDAHYRHAQAEGPPWCRSPWTGPTGTGSTAPETWRATSGPSCDRWTDQRQRGQRSGRATAIGDRCGEAVPTTPCYALPPRSRRP